MPYEFPVRSIVIDTGGRKLYYVLGDNRAYAYPISVGREGFNWTGTETVSRKQAWPDWHPPAEMRERDDTLPEKMTGGIKNPLGAMALYLGNTLYRIHGTSDVKSIGHAELSGCFRMVNAAVLHLASLTEIGTTVSVVTSLPTPRKLAVPKSVPLFLSADCAASAPPPPPKGLTPSKTIKLCATLHWQPDHEHGVCGTPDPGGRWTGLRSRRGKARLLVGGLVNETGYTAATYQPISRAILTAITSWGTAASAKPGLCCRAKETGAFSTRK